MSANRSNIRWRRCAIFVEWIAQSYQVLLAPLKFQKLCINGSLNLIAGTLKQENHLFHGNK